ncbi:MAG TPA: AmmeMemoRadiSam system protein B, partial [SAR202 cluster bacterium]|nr:AmmeMemoRadiSam system protein B [SAR202 cluster bacterium]
LAHVGPAFGDRLPLDADARSNLATADQKSIDAILAGDPEAFLDLSRQEEDARKICGLSAIYLTLRLLQGAQGEAFGYDQCPADDQNGSAVSIVGALLYDG